MKKLLPSGHELILASARGRKSWSGEYWPDHAVTVGDFAEQVSISGRRRWFANFTLADGLSYWYSPMTADDQPTADNWEFVWRTSDSPPGLFQSRGLVWNFDIRPAIAVKWTQAEFETWLAT